MASIAAALYQLLADRFPVSCASDEFIFFPQAAEEKVQSSGWDDYSPDSVQSVLSELGRIEGRLALLDNRKDQVRAAADIRSLGRVVRTLAEQLDRVGTHREQPTYHLTVATAGVWQAVECGEPRILEERLTGLSTFLENSLAALSSGRVPDLFLRSGVEMARQVENWLAGLTAAGAAVGASAVSRFRQAVEKLPTRPSCLPGTDNLERIVFLHMGTGLSAAEAVAELEEERESMASVLRQEAAAAGCGRDWEAAFRRIPPERMDGTGREGMLQAEILRLRDHCLAQRFLTPAEITGDVEVARLPVSLTAVRAADSYNARPGHPYRGGTFFIFGGGTLGSSGNEIHPAYRMTAAHETWPGHHLLDLFRWNNPEPVRRPLEYPLFYEGWACFAEDMMLETGAFDRPGDRLILARRRFRHAVRGIVDLLLARGSIDGEEAAARLYRAGFSRERARATVGKYALRPGYQLCYTLGRRRFHSLLESSGMGIPGFVRTVLREGEVGFADLGRVFSACRHNS